MPGVSVETRDLRKANERERWRKANNEIMTVCSLSLFKDFQTVKIDLNFHSVNRNGMNIHRGRLYQVL